MANKEPKAGAASSPESEGESQVSAGFESRAQELLENFDMKADSIGGALQEFALDLFKHRPKPWDAMLEAEQQSVARSLRLAVNEALAEACLMIAEGGQHSVQARLEKFGGKGGKYQATLVTQGGPELAMELAKLDGRTVLIIDADARDFEGGSIGSAPDQRPLEFDEEPETPPHDEETGEILEEDEEAEGGDEAQAEPAEAEA